MKYWAILSLLICCPAFAQHADSGGGFIHSTTSIPAGTVAALPACNGASNGVVRIVTNALSPTVGATVAGVGAVQVLVHCNGTNWIVA